MKDRIKEIRNSNPSWRSQDQFADFLGIPKANLSSYETGRRTPTDAVIQLICQKCFVNEEWLRNGTGEMFIQRNKVDKIAEMLADIELGDPSQFKNRLISALAELDSVGWDALEKLIDNIAAQK